MQEKLKSKGLGNGKIINLMKSEIESIGGDASFRRFYRFKLNKLTKKEIIKENIENLMTKCHLFKPKV